MKEKLVIAIDGYSSCGKSTFAKSIARKLDYKYIDSGAMYRAVTLFCLRNNLIHAGVPDAKNLISQLDNIKIDFRRNKESGDNETYLNDDNVEKEIRSIVVADNVSAISMIHEVRELMVELQQQMGSEKGIVMDGRDIGTVVFPGAEIKIFMTASSEIRARRRFDELIAKNVVADYEEVKRNIIARDIADENRDISPLRRADDAIILDNSRMSVKQQMDWFDRLLEKYNNESRS